MEIKLFIDEKFSDRKIFVDRKISTTKSIDVIYTLDREEI